MAFGYSDLDTSVEHLCLVARAVAEEFKIPVSLILAIMGKESSYGIDTVTPGGTDQGVMQLTDVYEQGKW